MPRLIVVLRAGRSCAVFLVYFGGGRGTSGSEMSGLSTKFSRCTYLPPTKEEVHVFARVFVCLSAC